MYPGLFLDFGNCLILQTEKMSALLKLWGAGTARTLRPIWMAEELEIDYELIPIGPRTGETQTKEFSQINPKQKIPVMEHKDCLLYTSPSPRDKRLSRMPSSA